MHAIRSGPKARLANNSRHTSLTEDERNVPSLLRTEVNPFGRTFPGEIEPLRRIPVIGALVRDLRPALGVRLFSGGGR
jgi:hypothetical protein